MKIQLFKNTDGFLGAWATGRIVDPALAFEMSNAEQVLFHKAVDGRDNVEILPRDALQYDAQFGNLKLLFHSEQSAKLLKLTREAHKLNKDKSDLESALFS